MLRGQSRSRPPTWNSLNLARALIKAARRLRRRRAEAAQLGDRFPVKPRASLVNV
jgi:hypothetical protein